MTARHLEGETVIVTGAANGMGTVHAKMLAEMGARIVANDVLPKVQQVVDDIVAAGGQAVASVHDVTDPAQAQAIVQTALDSFGKLDGVILNAAVNQFGSFEDMTYENFDRSMKINGYGIFNVAKAAWPVFTAQQHGRFVFIGAGSSITGVPGMASYNASKSVPLGLSTSLAAEGADRGITSNIVFPAAITEMSGAAMDDEMKQRLSAKLRPEWVTPIVAWLLRRENTLNQKIVMASSSRASSVFFGWTPGYTSKDINVQELIDNEAAVFDTDGYITLVGIEPFMDFILR